MTMIQDGVNFEPVPELAQLPNFTAFEKQLAEAKKITIDDLICARHITIKPWA